MVACAINDKIINHTVIVFSGKQGIGKTTWMENLVPVYLKNHLFSGTINPNNKDTLIHLAECMLINLDELENLNRTEIGSLKEIITKSHIRVRKAYGHNNETLPPRASFAGSVNTAQFLNDTTGSRRFLCFATDDLDRLDYALTFFQNCYHLKNWIPAIERINHSEWNKKWEEFISKNIEIKICRDICNSAKHLKLDKPSIVKGFGIFREYEPYYEKLGERPTEWKVVVNGQKYSLPDLMNACINESVK